jgi:hypothetical protein
VVVKSTGNHATAHNQEGITMRTRTLDMFGTPRVAIKEHINGEWNRIIAWRADELNTCYENRGDMVHYDYVSSNRPARQIQLGD